MKRLALVATLLMCAHVAHAEWAGNVGGSEIQATPVTPAVTAASSHAVGTSLGGLLQYLVTRIAGNQGPNAYGNSGIVQTVGVGMSVATPSLDVFLFNSTPVSTCTDNAAFQLNAADLPKLIGVPQVTTYFSGGTFNFGAATGLSLPFRAATGTNIFACYVVRSTVVTPASTTDMQTIVGVIQD